MTATRVDRWALRARLVHRAWRYRLRTEAAEVAFVRRQLAPGQTAIDVGAHRGAFTYWMLRAVGRDGRVVAVEPIPELAAYLRAVRAGCRYSQLDVVEAALSAQVGSATLHVPAGGYLGTATLVTQDAGHATVRVDATTLDTLAGGRPVHFIKCDVEGHELDVLRGARRVLERDRPTLLVEAVDDRPAPGQTTRVFDLLRAAGYVGYYFARTGMMPIERFRVDRDQADPATAWHVNFGFVPAESPAAVGALTTRRADAAR